MSVLLRMLIPEITMKVPVTSMIVRVIAMSVSEIAKILVKAENTAHLNRYYLNISNTWWAQYSCNKD